MIQVECPACQARLRTSEQKRGHRLKCPACHEVVVVPIQQPDAVEPSKRTRLPKSIDDKPSERKTRSRSDLKTRSDSELKTMREQPSLPEAGTGTLARTSSSTSTVSELDEVQSAPRLHRALGYLLDALLTVILAPLILVPLIGNVLIGILLVLYWLFRDVTGASLGKYVFNCEVVSLRESARHTRMHRILRNVPLAIGPLAFAVPFVGYMLGLIVAPVILSIEAIMVLATGRRVGDLLAGTTVRKKFPQTPATNELAP